MDAMDVKQRQASEHEMSSFVKVDEEEDLMTAETKLEALPWTMAEELVAGHVGKEEALQVSSISRALSLAATMLILASMAGSVVRRATSSLAGQPQAGKTMRYEV